ncbi:MAG TPA: hypothetical protein DCY79_18470, partial [Planctomycetaceae bacterium]|nr:hypothetical protein [Planctomycetaceae bacterium]
MLKANRFRSSHAFSLVVLALVVATIGCKSPSMKSSMVQSQVPAWAHSIAGPMACPHCGLLCGQGCMCRPDPWNAGYHPTCWSFIDVEPCTSQVVAHESGTMGSGEALPGSVMNAAPGQAAGAPNAALPQPAGQP